MSTTCPSITGIVEEEDKGGRKVEKKVYGLSKRKFIGELRIIKMPLKLKEFVIKNSKNRKTTDEENQKR